MNFDRNGIQHHMIASLWKLVTRHPAENADKTCQRRALRLLLQVRGGCEFVISRPNKELDELAQRGIWQEPVILQELAGLELQRRRLLSNLAHIDSQSRRILRDLKLAPRIPRATLWEREHYHCA